MRNILLLFARYGAHILFIGLEIFCFILIVNYNKTQKDIYLNSINLFSGNLNQQVNKLGDYLNLQEVNDSLNIENARLLQQIINLKNTETGSDTKDSLFQYKLIPAKICNKTIHLKNNYLTLCKGKNHGIKKGMGVVSQKGIVGSVKSVSNNFSIVLPVINVLSKTSVAIKNRNFFGTLTWKNMNPLKMTIEEIPKHAQITVGDTIMTSGYSSIFPKGIEMGRITNFSIEPGSANYTIDVQMDEDLSNLEYVFVVDYINSFEKDSLQNTLLNE